MNRLHHLFWSMLHNCIGHPGMFLFDLVGFKNLGDWIHDVTLPNEWTRS